MNFAYFVFSLKMEVIVATLRQTLKHDEHIKQVSLWTVTTDMQSCTAVKQTLPAGPWISAEGHFCMKTL